MRVKTFLKIILVLAVITAIVFVGVNIINTHNSDTINPSGDKTNTDVNVPEKVFTGLDGVEKLCNVTEFFTYGTSFCLSGSLNTSAEKSVADVYIILSQAYDSKNLSSDSETYTYSAIYNELPENQVTFSSYEKINDGINLENIANGSYCILIKAIYTDGEYDYYSLSYDTSSNSSDSTICYYTITQTEKTTNKNQRIDIGFSTENNMPYGFFNVCYDSLPDDVYDIVIDPGHGGTDVGAKNGSYYESDIVLDYSLALKKALEECGYKVKLTRDGTEDPDTPMAYTMYDDDGRVNIAGKSNAKLCLSIHLNSNEGYVYEGGVQVYVSCRGSSTFAKSLADNISEKAGTPKSDMAVFQITPGVYTRAFSESDVADSRSEAAAGGYQPYDVDTTTDYYYMIRELGGVATNAYVDGRKTTYGANRYVASIQGIESYIVELGFLSVDRDFQNLLSNKDKYIEGMVYAINSRFQKNTD